MMDGVATIEAPQVWKFPIEPKTGWTEIDLPHHAEILHVAEMDLEMYVWAKVPARTRSDWREEQRYVTWRLAFVATGEDIPAHQRGTRQYLTTMIVTRHVPNAGKRDLVYHVFLER